MNSSNSVLLQMENGESKDVADLVKEYIVTGCSTDILSTVWNAKVSGNIEETDLSELPEEDTTLLKKTIIRTMLISLVSTRKKDESIGMPSYFELGDDLLAATNRIIIDNDILRKEYLTNEWMKNDILNQIICDRIDKDELSQLIDDITYFVKNLQDENGLAEICLSIEENMEESYEGIEASVNVLYVLYSVLSKCEYDAKYQEIERLIACALEDVDKSEVIESLETIGCFKFMGCGLELLDVPESIVEKIKKASSCILINNLWWLTESELCKQISLTEDELTTLLNAMEKIALASGKKVYIHHVERCKKLQKKMYSASNYKTQKEKYYKIRFNDRRGNNWLMVYNCREGNNVWYGGEHLAAAFASHLFVENNILTRFLRDKSYEKIELVEDDTSYYYADKFF